MRLLCLCSLSLHRLSFLICYPSEQDLKATPYTIQTLLRRFLRGPAHVGLLWIRRLRAVGGQGGHLP